MMPRIKMCISAKIKLSVLFLIFLLRSFACVAHLKNNLDKFFIHVHKKGELVSTENHLSV